MTRLRVYIAVSLDGYIADAEGGVAWLDAYHDPEVDWMGFMKSIGVTVFGRKTWDAAADHAGSYGRAVVLTHRPLGDAPDGVEAFEGDVRDLAARLRAELDGTGKDVWLMGGGESIRPFHEAGLVDRWELFWIPTLLGDGVPLFPRGGPGTERLRPTHSRTYGKGIVEVWYEPVR